MKIIKKLVGKNLLLNKKRTVVTTIGIILSVALLSSMSTMVASFQKSLISYQKQKAGDFHVGYLGATVDDLKDFDNNRCIEHYFTISNLGFAKLEESKNEYKPYCRIVAADEGGFKDARLDVIEGHLPEKSDEIVIPRHLKTNGRVEYEVGDTLTLHLGTRVATENGEKLGADIGYWGEDAEEIVNTVEKTYKVVGIVERPIYGIEPYECPAYTFITYTEEPENDIAVYTRFNKQGMKDTDAVIAGILGVDEELFSKVNSDGARVTQEEFEEYGKQMDAAKYAIYINSWLISYEKVWPLDSTLLVIFVIAAIVTSIIIFTSIYCIKNSFDISITEKIRQYGMLSSIGATKRQIKKSVHTEAAIMGCFGIPIGVLCGMLAGFILIQVSNILLAEGLNLNLVFYPSVAAIIIAVLLGIVTIYFSAAGSARKAGKVSPMEAIRNQNEIKLSAKSIKTPKYVGKLWGIGGVISYKNIKRNKKKYRTTVVSIVICTVTFIVISYFMSMAMDLVSASYTDDGYNVSLSLNMSEGYPFDFSQIRELENVEEFNITQSNYMTPQNFKFTDDYKAYWKYMGMEESDVNLVILTLDEDYFVKYASECGLIHPDGKVILVNNCVAAWEENGKKKSGVIDTFRYKAGDTIQFYDTDDSEARWDENDELIEDSVKKIEYQAKIGAVTDVRPMGYRGNKETNYLVMSQKTAEKMNIRMPNLYDFFFVSDHADKLQEDIDIIVQNCDDETAGYSIFNRDKNEREEKSLFLLLDIFAYGLIMVIALIGITNIINTLNTSMELRSREFATLRSVGMTDKQFNRMVLLESLFTSAKSLVIGVTVGMIISYGIHWFECTYDVMIPFRPPILSAIIAVAIVMILIYAIISSSMLKINRRNIIETIKNENL